MKAVKYYDIGLNLFCKQFPDPEKVIEQAENNGVCCILTGTDRKENKIINDFVKTHDVFGTAGIHPHNADRAKQEDFQLVLPDGFVTNAALKNYAMPYISFR